MKRFYLMVMAVAMACFLLIPGLASAKKMGSGEVTAGNVNIEIFGSLAVQPKFVSDANFGEKGGGDFLFYTNGKYADHAVRQQSRLGFKGGNENFSFLMTLESEWNYDADNADRENAANAESGALAGSSGSDFGIERMHMEYNALPVDMFAGWDFYSIDARGGGGFMLGDDIPYIGVKGTLAEGVTWDVRYFVRDDGISGTWLNREGQVWAENGDWRFATANMVFPAGPMNFQPTYIYSVANIKDSPETARTNYLGFSTWGNLDIGAMNLTPKAEFFYALGEMEDYQMANGEDSDIRSMGAFAGAEMTVSPAVTPYFGGYWLQGDDEAHDDEINAFNAPTNAAAILGMFGMPNGLLNQGWLAYGKAPFTNQPETLGDGSPYGTVGLSGSSTNPGLQTLGLGFKGTVMENLSYKTQYQYMMYEETGALEDQNDGISIDNEMGHMFDLNLTYRLSKNYSIGNTFSYFQPGEGIEDRKGSTSLDPTIYDSVNFTFHF